MRVRVSIVFACLFLTASACISTAQNKQPLKGATGTVYTNAVVEAMDGNPPYQAIAINGAGIIQAVGTNAALQPYIAMGYANVPMNGQTMLPGFIDSHSHASTFGVFDYPQFTSSPFIDVGSVNVMLKPLPGTTTCTTPTNSQACFIPVQSQADVVARLTAAVAAAKSGASVVGFNYEPARQGNYSGCPTTTNVGLDCPNFLTGNTMQMLDAISSTVPIAVTAESGHYVFINSAMYKQLNICAPKNPANGCYTPTTSNPAYTNIELTLAAGGLLQEELALHGEGQIVPSQLGTANLVPAVKLAMTRYSYLGFTTVQEGAANEAVGLAYKTVAMTQVMPVTVSLLIHEDTPADAVNSIKTLNAAFSLLPFKGDVIVSGLKIFADGSNQGFTGLQTTAYLKSYPPFNNPAIYTQPYLGIEENTQASITQATQTAHGAGVPIYIHANGDAGVANAVNGIVAAGPVVGAAPDVIIHSSFISPTLVATAQSNNIALTMLAANLYYYGAPMCNQVFALSKLSNIYPEATGAGPAFGLHSDSDVTPPAPLFSMWTAVTRNVQQTSWYGLPTGCPAQLNSSPSLALTIRQAVQAYTSSAAGMYGLTDRGVLAPNMRGDIVVLSADPLAASFTANQFQNIQVIETMRNGHVFVNPNPSNIPWPN